MKIAVFINSLTLGGTEKAACRWMRGLKERGNELRAISLQDGPRRAELDAIQLRTQIVSGEAELSELITKIKPDVIHTHAPGHPHAGDLLGKVLKCLPKIPVVQTNIFGQLENPKEDEWTNYRLFISWTSCVQAARRAFRPLDEQFFKRSSVAVYPLDPRESAPLGDVQTFRKNIDVAEDEILFGRISRPDPVKWTQLAVDAFRLALAKNSKIKLLLREPPPEVAKELKSSAQKNSVIILPATSSDSELLVTMSALDVVLHTSRLGESFGYGIAEPMNLGKPVITHSVPSLDQAQLELVRHGESGLIANLPETMSEAMLQLAAEPALRRKMGECSRTHIRELANAEVSISRLESILKSAIEQRDNPFVAEDLLLARRAASNLDRHQFGHTAAERRALRILYYRSRFYQFRQMLKLRLLGRR